MKYLTLEQVLELHKRIVNLSGGSHGIRSQGGVESAIAQPQMTFGGEELYPSVVEKAVALGFSLIQNHPFIDGNKRIGHAAMEVFLLLNGYEIDATVDEQESIILGVASSSLSRDAFAEWIASHLVEFTRK